MATGKIIALVGPTGSGKTALALQLSQQSSIEIISADSRTVYRGLDIGAAKPTPEEQRRIPHHLLDVAEPDQTFSAAEFKRQAEAAINDIWQRGKVPLLVGGTGLYIDSLLYDYQFPAVADPHTRHELDGLTMAKLQQRVEELGVELNDSDYANRRRLVRALETAGQPRQRLAKPRWPTLVIGLGVNKSELRIRLTARVEKMLSQGLLSEVSTLIKRYGIEKVESFGIAYAIFAGVVVGVKTLEAAKEEILRADLNLAKRQSTWFKRNPDIHWITDPSEVTPLVQAFLNGRAAP